jgi:hypothetical protein
MKADRKMSKLLLAAVLAGGLLLGSTGCSAPDEAAEKVAEKVIEQQTGEESAVEVGGGQLPDEWPSDVPLPEDFKLDNVAEVTAMGSKQTTVVGDTGASTSDLVDLYRGALEGWDNPRSNERQDERGRTVTSASFTKGDRILSVTITDQETHRELHLNHNAPAGN